MTPFDPRPNHRLEDPDDEGSESCACGVVSDWPEVWEACGAVIRPTDEGKYYTSHAPVRMGGCFTVDPKGA